MGRFLKYHFGVIFFFSLLYWMQDIYSNRPQKETKKDDDWYKAHTQKHTQEKKSESVENFSKSGTFSNFCYWLWFSFLTQTTVGYGLKSLQLVMGFDAIPGPFFLTLNTMQLASVLLITAVSI